MHCVIGKGRKEGRKEERKEGRKEGRKVESEMMCKKKWHIKDDEEMRNRSEERIMR